MGMYKKEGNKGFETYKEEKGHKTTMAPPRMKSGARSEEGEHLERHTKTGSRIGSAFTRKESEPLYTRHKGKPSGYMDDK